MLPWTSIVIPWSSSLVKHFVNFKAFNIGGIVKMPTTMYQFALHQQYIIIYFFLNSADCYLRFYWGKLMCSFPYSLHPWIILDCKDSLYAFKSNLLCTVVSKKTRKLLKNWSYTFFSPALKHDSWLFCTHLVI